MGFGSFFGSLLLAEIQIVFPKLLKLQGTLKLFGVLKGRTVFGLGGLSLLPEPGLVLLPDHLPVLRNPVGVPLGERRLVL